MLRNLYDPIERSEAMRERVADRRTRPSAIVNLKNGLLRLRQNGGRWRRNLWGATTGKLTLLRRGTCVTCSGHCGVTNEYEFRLESPRPLCINARASETIRAWKRVPLHFRFRSIGRSISDRERRHAFCDDKYRRKGCRVYIYVAGIRDKKSRGEASKSDGNVNGNSRSRIGSACLSRTRYPPPARSC